MSRFRKMSNAEISLWKKSKNKMLALKAMRDEQEENPDAPDGIPYYEVETPIVRHQDYVEPIYSDGRIIRTRTGVRRKYLDHQLADMRANTLFKPHPRRHFRSTHNFKPRMWESTLKSFSRFIKESTQAPKNSSSRQDVIDVLGKEFVLGMELMGQGDKSKPKRRLISLDFDVDYEFEPTIKGEKYVESERNEISK